MRSFHWLETYLTMGLFNIKLQNYFFIAGGTAQMQCPSNVVAEEAAATGPALQVALLRLAERNSYIFIFCF